MSKDLTRSEEEALILYLAKKLRVRHPAEDTPAEWLRYYRELLVVLGKRDRLAAGWRRQYGVQGRPKEWDDDRLCKLFADATVVGHQHRDWNDLDVCRELVSKDGPYRRRWAQTASEKPRKAEGLLNKLREARRLPAVQAILEGKGSADDRGRFLAIYALFTHRI